VEMTYLDSHGRDCGPDKYLLDYTTRWGTLQTEVKTVHHVAKILR
jgi:hypothetical protein